MGYSRGGRWGVVTGRQKGGRLDAGEGITKLSGRPSLPPVKVVVQGVVDLPAADSMFQAVGAPPGSSPQAPPDNVVLLPQTLWESTFGPVSKQPAAVHFQYHVKLSPALAPDPAVAFTDVTA